MITEARAAQLRSPGDFADGLRDWMRGDETCEAEAAGLNLAEVVLLHRAWLRAHIKKD